MLLKNKPILVFLPKQTSHFKNNTLFNNLISQFFIPVCTSSTLYVKIYDIYYLVFIRYLFWSNFDFLMFA